MAGQLSLFKGPRQRGVKPPPPPEFKLHVSIADTLRDWAAPDWLWSHFGSGEERAHQFINGKRVSFAGARLKRMGLRKGLPDFGFFHLSGHCAFVELKRVGATTTEEQDEVLEFLARCGHATLVSSSYAEVVAWLKGLGILPSRFRVQ